MPAPRSFLTIIWHGQQARTVPFLAILVVGAVGTGGAGVHGALGGRLAVVSGGLHGDGARRLIHPHRLQEHTT